MFETPQTKGETSGTGLWVGIAVVVVVIVGGIVFYMSQKGGAQSATPAAATVAATPQSNADAVKDLRVVSKKMDKDYTGTTASWSIELRNLSQTYTYSNIQYQTTYIGRDGTVLANNNGTIPSLTLDPGDSQSAQFRDALYPSGTVLFNFKVTGATATK
jgi:hypothetical protein